MVYVLPCHLNAVAFRLGRLFYQTPNFERCQSGPHPGEPDMSPTSMRREAGFHFLPSCVSPFKRPQSPTSESPWITRYLNEPTPRLPWLLTFLNDES